MPKKIKHPIISEFEVYVTTKNLSRRTIACIYLPVVKCFINKIGNSVELEFTKEHFVSTLSDYSYDKRREKVAIHVLKVFTKFIYSTGRISEDSEIIPLFYKNPEDIKKPISKQNKTSNSELKNILDEYKLFLSQKLENPANINYYFKIPRELLCTINKEIKNLKVIDVENFVNLNYDDEKSIAYSRISLFFEFLNNSKHKEVCSNIIKKYYIPPSPRIPELDAFLSYFKSCGKSESTVYGYNNFLTKFFESLSEYKRNNIKLITVQDVEKYLMLYNHVTVLSLNSVKSSLKAFFSYCKKNEWINKDLITDVLVLKKPPKRNKVVFSNKEIDKIYDALSKNKSDEKFMHYTIFSVLYQFGIRVSSLVRLKVSNIEFDNNRVRYFDCKSKTWAYGYPPDEGIMVLLKDYIDMQGLSDSDTYLFRDSDANPISSSNVRDIIYHYYNKAGIQEKYKHNNQNKNKYNVHTLRFYFITSLCKAGVPETTVQKVIHHKNINNTGIYNIFQENDIRKGIKDSLYTKISQPYATESEVN